MKEVFLGALETFSESGWKALTKIATIKYNLLWIGLKFLEQCRKYKNRKNTFIQLMI